MPDFPEYRAEDEAHPPAALIKAALLHNNLPLEEGFSAFDVVSDHFTMCLFLSRAIANMVPPLCPRFLSLTLWFR